MVIKIKHLTHRSSVFPFGAAYGASFIKSMYAIMREDNSSLLLTRIPRRRTRDSFPNHPSIMFSHEPCFGVKTNSNLLGTLSKYAIVSLEEWHLWLSKTIFITFLLDTCCQKSFRCSMNSASMTLTNKCSVILPDTRSMLARSESFHVA